MNGEGGKGKRKRMVSEGKGRWRECDEFVAVEGVVVRADAREERRAPGARHFAHTCAHARTPHRKPVGANTGRGKPFNRYRHTSRNEVSIQMRHAGRIS